MAFLAGITWEPNIHGGLVVLTAIIILPGTVYLVLATNTGARLGFLLALTGFFGWMSIMGVVWWVYGIGPKGRAPEWKAKEVVVSSLANACTSDVAGFPNGWEKLALEDPATTEALAAGDPILVPPAGEPGPKFFDAGGYVTTGAFQKGGERHGPFNVLNFRPFNLWHTPHFFVLQVERSVKVETVAGQAAPTPRADRNAPVISVIMVRDLGREAAFHRRRWRRSRSSCSRSARGRCIAATRKRWRRVRRQLPDGSVPPAARDVRSRRGVRGRLVPRVRPARTAPPDAGEGGAVRVRHRARP